MSGIDRVRDKVERVFEALPTEYRDNISLNGGVEVRFAAEGVEGYGREIALVDLFRDSADDEFGFCIWLNNRIRLGLIYLALQHELAHVIDVLQVSDMLGLDAPYYSEYERAFAAAGFEGDPEYAEHGNNWRRIFSRLSGIPVDVVKSSGDYRYYIRSTAVAGRGRVGVYCAG